MGVKLDSPVIGMSGWGSYIPETFVSAAEIAEKSGIPEKVIIEKIGLKKKPIASEKETPAFMAAEAARKAIRMAEIDPLDIDCVIYNGGQHKDYICWLAGSTSPIRSGRRMPGRSIWKPCAVL